MLVPTVEHATHTSHSANSFGARRRWFFFAETNCVCWDVDCHCCFPYFLLVDVHFRKMFLESGILALLALVPLSLAAEASDELHVAMATLQENVKILQKGMSLLQQENQEFRVKLMKMENCFHVRTQSLFLSFWRVWNTTLIRVDLLVIGCGWPTGLTCWHI